jgi:hypothetical protein
MNVDPKGAPAAREGCPLFIVQLGNLELRKAWTSAADIEFPLKKTESLIMFPALNCLRSAAFEGSGVETTSERINARTVTTEIFLKKAFKSSSYLVV